MIRAHRYFCWSHAISRVGIVVTLIIGFCVTDAHAAGFALIEQGASGQGNAYAGAAAVAEDATTVYFNPAGMSFLEPGSHFLAAGHLIRPHPKFKDNGSSYRNAGGSGALPGPDARSTENGLVPNIYYVTPLGDSLRFGFGVGTPFGLAVHYDPAWKGRYHAIDSDLTTINLNPSLAYRVNEQLAVGMGVNVQYISSELTSAIDFGSQVGLAPSPLTDGFVKLEGDGMGYGFNLGALFEPVEGTRIGLAYRSEIAHELEGDAAFSVPEPFEAAVAPSGMFVDSEITAEIDLPASASLSLTQQLGEKTQLLADVTWTQWSSFEELRVTFSNPAQPDAVTPEEWEDSWRYSLGVIHKLNDRWSLRGGWAFDETPIPDPERRTPRIPGNDRTWFSFGFSYFPSDDLRLDAGYTRLYAGDASIRSDDENGHLLVGQFESETDILSVQAQWSFE